VQVGVINERFETFRVVGAGAMGTVYQAHDLRTGRTVAVKVMRSRAPGHTERFLREGWALAQLHHPAIVRHIDHGVDADGVHYIAMEWLDGNLLSKRLEAGPLSIADTIALMKRLSRALAAIHALGLVHRDVKPSNILLVEDRVTLAKVLDFGVVHSEKDDRITTESGVLIGTPGYLAPEQARSARAVDARADVFAAGCVMFKCLTGRSPFAGDTVHSLLAQTLFAPIPPPGQVRDGVPRALDALACRMLAKSPSDRIRDGVALMTDFDALEDAAGETGGRSDAAGIEDAEHRLIAVLQVGMMGAEDTKTESLTAPQGGPADDVLVPALASRYGGAFELLITGESIITFLAQEAATDLARRAARCALAIHRHEEGLAIGLAMGSARMSAMAMGAVFDRAEQLARLPAAVDRTYVDDTVAALVAGRFLLQHDDLGTWIADERAGVDDVGALLGRKAPFVGRATEMALLRDAWQHCSRTRTGRIVVVTGEPGMGKSRLRREFQRELARASVRSWFGMADPAHGAAPRSPIEHMVRAQVGVFGSELPEAARRLLQTSLSKWVDAQQVERVAIFLGELLGIPPESPTPEPLRAAQQDPRLMGDQVRRAVCDLIDAGCRDHPLVMILDDLHAADRATIELLDEVMRRLRERPVLLVALGRPEVLERFPSLWQHRSPTHVRLSPLASDAARVLVDAVVSAKVPEQDREDLVRHAAGNPFFLEELIRHRESGGVDALPQSLVAMVQSRLERLPPESRRALRAASVFGVSFPVGGLLAVLGHPRADIGPVLASLVDQEVLDEPCEERGSYGFRHALLSEASYEMLTAEDRLQGHRIAAAWLLSAGETNLALVAQHWERAACFVEAGRAFAAAAERARETGALGAAIEHAERGLRVSAHPDLRCDLLSMQAEAHAWRGELDAAVEAASRALAEGTVIRPSSLRAAGVRADSLARLGRSEEATRAIERLLSMPACAELEPQRVTDAYAALGSLLTTSTLSPDRLIDLRAGLDEHAQGVGAAGPGVAAARCRALAWWSLIVTENPEDYLLWSLEAVRQAKAAGDDKRAAEASHDAGFAYVMVGDHASAISILREGAHRADRLGLGRAGATCEHNLGLALARQGQVDEALDVEMRALRAFEAQGYPRFVTACRVYLSEILRVAGRLVDARDAAALAVTEAEPRSDVAMLALAQLAQTQVDLGQLDDARATEQNLRQAPSRPIQEEGEQNRIVRVEVLLASGNHVEARRLIVEACERILAKASRIQDPKVRARFTRRVPANARALRLGGI
jgi:tetratricopeptide (TPR) repeat protein